ncbi:MAG: type II toxin-antitoxin system Phd/YefM family antitoxin [Allosphingosinicella sp.]
MQAISYSEARDNLKAVMDKAVADRAPILITRQRGENVVLISADEWAGMEETLHLLVSPRNAERLLASIAELDAGKGEGHEVIEP